MTWAQFIGFVLIAAGAAALAERRQGILAAPLADEGFLLLSGISLLFVGGMLLLLNWARKGVQS